jgi:hypothetical protein
MIGTAACPSGWLILDDASWTRPILTRIQQCSGTPCLLFVWTRRFTVTAPARPALPENRLPNFCPKFKLLSNQPISRGGLLRERTTMRIMGWRSGLRLATSVAWAPPMSGPNSSLVLLILLTPPSRACPLAPQISMSEISINQWSQVGLCFNAQRGAVIN